VFHRRNALEHAPIEAGDDHPLHGPAAFHQLHDLMLDGIGRAAGFKGTCLDFDIHQAPVPGELEHLAQFRYAFHCKARVKPAAGIQSPDFLQTVKPDRSFAVGRAIEGIVMDDDHLTVSGQGDVQFDHVTASEDGPLKGRKGVFGKSGRVAPVADDERTRPGDLERICCHNKACPR